MTLVVYIVGFAAVLLLTVGIGGYVSQFRFADQNLGVRAGHSLLSGPLGPMISSMARRNREGGAAKRCAELSKKLIYAGRPVGDLNGYEYYAVLQLIALSVFVVVALLTVAGTGPSLAVIIVPGLLAGAVFVFATAWLDNEIADRRSAISMSFPYFMDLSVMTMEAGADFRESVESYIADNRGDALADELSITLNEMRMGRVFQEAMERMTQRIAADEVVSIIRTIMQGDRMGTPLGRVFRDQADTLRFRRSQMAERAAEEMKVKLQGPAMLLMMSVLVLIMGPALLQMFSSDFF